MKFCCMAFERVTHGEPIRSFSVFVEEYNDKPLFFLQFRAMDRHEPLPGERPPGQMILATETRLIYCPWCGLELAEFYSKSWKELAIKTAQLNLDNDNWAKNQKGS